MAVEKFSATHMMNTSTSMNLKKWKQVWKLKVMPRVKMFIYKACSNALPTRANLFRRGCITDPVCGLHGEKMEDIEHLFLRCTAVTPVWYASMA